MGAKDHGGMMAGLGAWYGRAMMGPGGHGGHGSHGDHGPWGMACLIPWGGRSGRGEPGERLGACTEPLKKIAAMELGGHGPWGAWHRLVPWTERRERGEGAGRHAGHDGA